MRMQCLAPREHLVPLTFMALRPGQHTYSPPYTVAVEMSASDIPWDPNRAALEPASLARLLGLLPWLDRAGCQLQVAALEDAR